MSRISGATAQQSTPVSSSTMTMEEPKVSKRSEEKESSTQLHSHSEAQKQNAAARQGENNLTAMLQKERIADVPRAYIAKEEINAIATALTSRGHAAEDVKEELATTFINNAFGQHAKLAECMRQFAVPGSMERSTAYQVLKEGVREWTRFVPAGQTQSAQHNFFKEISRLHGPGAARVKADVALMIQRNMDHVAEPLVHGLNAYAGMFAHELREMLLSDPTGIFKTLMRQPGIDNEILCMVDNLVNHMEGLRAIGEVVIDMVVTTARQLMLSPLKHIHEPIVLGVFLDQVKIGIDQNAKTREQMIEKGANLLQFGLNTVEKLLGNNPILKHVFFDNVREAIDWQKNCELASVEETRQSFHSALNNLVDGTFRSFADPYGNLASGNSDDLAMVENYLNALEVFREYFEE